MIFIELLKCRRCCFILLVNPELNISLKLIVFAIEVPFISRRQHLFHFTRSISQKSKE